MSLTNTYIVMKLKLLIPAILFGAFFSSAAVVKEKIVNTKTEKVTVFFSGAQVNRSGSVMLNEGINYIIVPNVSDKILSNKIQAQMPGGARVMNIEALIAPISELQKKNSRADSLLVLKLSDSIAIYNKELRRIGYIEQTYLQEKKVVEQNGILTASTSLNYAAELTKLSLFCSTRLMEINKQLFLLSEDKNETVKKIEWVSEKRDKIKSGNKQDNISHIRITAIADIPYQCNFNLSYLVSGAGWAPKYLINVDEFTDQLAIDYNAGIINTSGENWENVFFTLSTADPTRDNIIPQLEPWVANKYTRSMNEGYLDSRGAKKNNNLNTAIQGVDYTQIEVPEVELELNIKDKYIIPSDGKPYFVSISKPKLKVNYNYYSTPKLDKDAFLVAQITNWGSSNLIEGPASIYYQGQYIGDSRITPQYANDTLDISLGRNKKILINRIKIEDKSSKKVLGNDVVEKISYRIVVRNTSSKPISMNMQDQIPVSSDNEVTIETGELSDGKLDVLNGMIDWKFDLKPEESKTFVFSFTARYPQNKSYGWFNAPVKKYRTVSCPRF